MFPIIDNIISEYDALILDLDGTLLDSMNVWTRVDEIFLSKRGIELTDDYTDYVKSVRIEQAAEYTAQRYGLMETPQQIMDEWNYMVASAYKDNIPLKDGAREYLLAASERGIKLGFATALSLENARASLLRNNVFDLFSSYLTLDDIEGNINKEEPDIYLRLASMLGVRPERCLVFEDIPKALEGARKGLFGTCAVYDRIGAGSAETWKSMENSADYCIIDWRNEN